MKFSHLALPLLLGLAVCASSSQSDSYKAGIETWRAQQESDLKASGGWLSVAGLAWLQEGDNTIGSDPTCEIKLPASAPGSVGILSREGTSVSLRAASGAAVLVDGKAENAADLKSDAAGAPTKVQAGSITFTIIQRGARVGVRVYDDNCPGRVQFSGMKWYPVDEHYRVKAKYVPYAKPRQIPIKNVLGDTSMNANPGYVEFELNDRKCRLEAQPEEGGLFINFQDATSGRTTYPAGRFLDAPNPADGYVILDFNEATNPPCAFTSFATCPLPPKGNRLSIAVEAGEKVYHGKR